MRKILETVRLIFREMTQDDLPALKRILQDEKTMWAYQHAFSDEEAQDWLNRQLQRYREDGFGLWAVVEKATGEMIGQCGITTQQWEGRRVPEIGYLLWRQRWHQGFATEAAQGCKRYAFETLKVPAVYSIILDTNHASQNVAKRNGMRPVGGFVKHYWGKDLPHTVFGIENENEH